MLLSQRSGSSVIPVCDSADAKLSINLLHETMTVLLVYYHYITVTGRHFYSTGKHTSIETLDAHILEDLLIDDVSRHPFTGALFVGDEDLQPIPLCDPGNCYIELPMGENLPW